MALNVEILLEHPEKVFSASDIIVGTSAGSAVGAQLTGATSLEELYDRQLRGDVAEIPGRLGVLGMVKMLAPMLLHRDPQKIGRAIGPLALSTGTERAGQRRGVITARLDGAKWSATRDLRIVAIDVDSGAHVVFTASGLASLEDAVLASCAVPGVWPVVTIDGRRYMDGGMRSPANVDIAADADRAIVIAPNARGIRRATSAEAQLERANLRGIVLAPDKAAKAAMGSNPLDPEARGAAARAGLAQAEVVVSMVTDTLQG